MDEIDGITTNAESSGIQELHKIVINNKKSNRYPVICTCNSIKNKKIKDLDKNAIFINLDKPSKINMLNLLNKICSNENIKLNEDCINNLINNSLEYRELINKLYQIKLKLNNKSKQEIPIQDNLILNYSNSNDNEIKFIENIASKIKHVLLKKLILKLCIIKLKNPLMFLYSIYT